MGTLFRTLSGRSFDLANPRASDVDPDDMVNSLARIPRYNAHIDTGSTRQTVWTVADHLYLAVQIGYLPGWRRGPADMLDLALHDSPEYLTGDMTQPLKAALRALGGGEALRLIEERNEKAVRDRFGLDWAVSHDTHVWIKRIDNIALWIEQLAFTNLHIDERARLQAMIPEDVRLAIPKLRPVSEATRAKQLRFVIESAAMELLSVRPELAGRGLADLVGPEVSDRTPVPKVVPKFKSHSPSEEPEMSLF